MEPKKESRPCATGGQDTSSVALDHADSVTNALEKDAIEIHQRFLLAFCASKLK